MGMRWKKGPYLINFPINPSIANGLHSFTKFHCRYAASTSSEKDTVVIAGMDIRNGHVGLRLMVMMRHISIRLLQWLNPLKNHFASSCPPLGWADILRSPQLTYFANNYIISVSDYVHPNWEISLKRSPSI